MDLNNQNNEPSSNTPCPLDKKTPPKPKQVLVLWNQTGVDVYELWREQGTRAVSWDADEPASDVGTVQEEMDTLVKAVRDNGFEVNVVNVEDSLERLIAAIRLHKPDIIFNLIEYFKDNENLEASCAGLYDLFDIPYTGSPPHVLLTCQDKIRTKVLFEDANIPTPAYMVVEKEPIDNPLSLQLEYPLIVKPSREDASGGIEAASIVHDYEALVARCRYVLEEFEQAVLVEEYIEGREIHVAIMGNENPEVLPLFEIEFDDSDFETDERWRPEIVSYSAKWDPFSKVFYTMDSVCPAEDIDDALAQKINALALRVYKVIQCRDYARMDMRIDEDGEPYVLEVNPNPDLADGSAYMTCAVATDRSYTDAIGDILKLPLDRRQKRLDKEAAKPKKVSDHLLRKYLDDQGMDTTVGTDGIIDRETINRHNADEMRQEPQQVDETSHIHEPQHKPEMSQNDIMLVSTAIEPSSDDSQAEPSFEEPHHLPDDSPAEPPLEVPHRHNEKEHE